MGERAERSVQPALTRAAAAAATAAEVAKLAGGIAQGLAVLAGQAETTAQELAAVQAMVERQGSELVQVKELAQPVRGAVFAVDKGIGLEADEVHRAGDRGSGAIERLAEQAARLSEEERLQLARAMYRVGRGR